MEINEFAECVRREIVQDWRFSTSYKDGSIIVEASDGDLGKTTSVFKLTIERVR